MISDHALAGLSDLRFERLHILLMAADLLVERVEADAEFLRLLLVLRDALLDGAALLDLRVQAAAGPLRLYLPLRELLARFGELVLDFVAGHLLSLVRLLALRHLIAEGLQFAGGCGEIDRRLGRVALQQAILAAEHDAQTGVELDLELAETLGLGRLPLEGVHLAGDFLQNVVDTGQVLLGAFQLCFGQALAGLEAGDAGGFLDHGAAVLRFGTQDLADAALFDDGVAFRSQTGAHEEVLYVAQAGGTAVDEVFAFARAVEAAGDGDLRILGRVAVLDGLQLVRRILVVDVGVHQGHGDVSHAERLAVAGSGEDHVLHAGAAEALGGLLTENPTDGIADVTLPAAVGADDGGDPFPVETELGAIAKALKSL